VGPRCHSTSNFGLAERGGNLNTILPHAHLHLMLINSCSAATDRLSAASLIRAQARALLPEGSMGALHAQLKRMPITQSTPQRYMWGSKKPLPQARLHANLYPCCFSDHSTLRMAVRLRSGGCHSWSPSLDGRQYPLQTATLKYFFIFIFKGDTYHGTSITSNLSSRSLLDPIVTVSREDSSSYFCKILHILSVSKCISETVQIPSRGVHTVRQQEFQINTLSSDRGSCRY
jgi:hypothetical protein